MASMPLYRVHFSATRAEPFPPLDTLPTTEGPEPTPEAIVAALHGMLSGFVSPSRCSISAHVPIFEIGQKASRPHGE